MPRLTDSLLPATTRAAIAAWTLAPAPLPLTGSVQPYAWGQRDAEALIPRLLGITPEPGRPYAELWLGAHPSAPATVAIGSETVRLDDLVAAAPAFVLGPQGLSRFGPQLPFLMKVLAAARPLSIQAHPDRAQAEAGFDHEEAAGIPLQAAHRTYRDRNHKPELIVALGDFFALKGFRPVEEIRADFASRPELSPLLPVRAGSGATPDTQRAWLQELLTRCLSTGAADAGFALDALLQRLERENHAHPFSRERREHWLLQAAHALGGAPGARDRGLLAFLLLNFVHLRDGQALFLGAGELHAYLEGTGVEVMANSDNVLRGGLTPKHVDVPALIATLTFDAGAAHILNAEADGRYLTPAPEFATTRLILAAHATVAISQARGADVLLVMAGRGQIAATSAHAGLALLVPAGLGAYAIKAGDAPMTVFRTSVPREG